MKKLKKYNEEKENSKILWMIFLVHIAVFIIDLVNLGHFFFSYIDKMDRRDNNEILRTSQRAYLDVNWAILNKDFLEQNINNFGIDDINSAKDYLTLEIKNTGASVAIIDVNKSNFTIEYDRQEGIIDGKEISKREISKVILNRIIKCKAISSGESMFIVFNSIDFYNSRSRDVSNNTYIANTEIYYKDLFGYSYEDICKYLNGRIVPKKDNSLIINNKDI